MSWLRIEGRMPHHRKIAPLSDAAFRLHVTAKAWCVEEESDGKVPTKVPATLPAAPRGKKLDVIVTELVDADLWEPVDGGYLIHDFLVYNPSAAESEAARAAKSFAGSLGGKRSAEVRASKPQAAASANGKQEASRAQAAAQANGKQNSSPIPIPIPTPEGEIPPPPSEPRNGPLPKDSFGDTLRKQPPGRRLDVLRVWERFKLRLKYPPRTKFRGDFDEDAKRIADRIDAYDEATCLAICDVAPADGMVNGTTDERGQTHDSVLYVFENQNTFNRLLRAAESAQAPKLLSAVEASRRARDIEPDDGAPVPVGGAA
jgi:hypothetical protein